MKPLPHVITDDEFFFANEEQRREWNARMAAGTEPQDLTKTAPLSLSLNWTPFLVGTWAETLQLWKEQRVRALADDDEADRRRGSWGQ